MLFAHSQKPPSLPPDRFSQELINFSSLWSGTFIVEVHFQAVYLISSYGAPLAQRASYLTLHSSLFGPVAQLIMIILSLTALTLS